MPLFRLAFPGLRRCRFASRLGAAAAALMLTAHPGLAATAPASTTPPVTTHLVQPGETLWQIAHDLGTDVATLSRLNDLGEDDVLFAGRSLQVPRPPDVARSAVHTVAEGEALWSIALRYGVSAAAILEANGIENADLLVQGRTLTIPGASPSAESAANGTPTSVPTLSATPVPVTTLLEATEAPRSPKRDRITTSYTVQPGETLSQIARQLNLPPLTIAEASGLADPNLLSVGMVLKIPVPTRDHLVQAGETLYGIAAREKVDLGVLIDYNDIADPALIRQGDVLLLPVPATGQQSATVAITPTPVGAAGQSTGEASEAPLAAPPEPGVAEPRQMPDAEPSPAAQARDPAPPPDPTATRSPTATPTPGSAGAVALVSSSPASSSSSASSSSRAPSASTPAPVAKPAQPSPTAAPATPTPALPPRKQVEIPAWAPRDGLAGEVLKLLGMPYVFGGSGPASFDCSGLVWYAAKQTSKSLPRGLFAQYESGPHPKKDELKPGDIVFFQNTYMAGLSHNGVYIGNRQFVHAADERSGVTISSLDAPYWAARYFGATRPA